MRPGMDKLVILCVDDEPTVLNSLKIDLRRALGQHCFIETAQGGEETLELLDDLKAEGYDLAVVIADYIMPGIKGDELLKRVHEEYPKALNIMLSGQADLDAVARSIEHAKLYRFMSKPWRVEDLTLTTEKALQSYLSQRQIEAKNAEIYQLNTNLTVLNNQLEEQVEQRTEQLQQTIQELEVLSQLKDDFLHAVSHDLRTPVAGMLMVLRRLQNRSSHDDGAPNLTDNRAVPVACDILDRLVQGSERQLKLLETLVEAHFSEIHGLPITLEPMAIDTFMKQIALDYDPWLQAQQATLVVQADARLPIVLADPLQLRRVYENIITNACTHNRPGIQITLTATQEGDRVQCEIRDNGVGMPQADCDRLFDRYARGGTRSKRSVGLGLGLFLCRQIIQAHYGEIHAQSELGQGLSITFSLRCQV